MHELFLALQAWWLENAAGPELLFGVRIISGALAFMAFSATLLNTIRPNEIEHTWDKADNLRFCIIAWVKVLGCLGAVLYFVGAALFEAERTSSPHRLLVSNTWVGILFFGLFLDAVAWRFHYLRKRITMREEGQDVEVKA